jgi:phosphoglycerate dehydrogenase-like enzyme
MSQRVCTAIRARINWIIRYDKARKQKIGIVGAGSVGATIAYTCMVRGIGKHVSLFDVARSKTR